MTKFLTSVRNADEAALAVASGADIVDFKDPDHGALGALDNETITQGIRIVAGRRPTSATAGDWPLDPAALVTAATRVAATGVDFVKLGLIPGDTLNASIDALRAVTRQYRLVVVFFADRGVPMKAIARLHDIGCAGVLIDTFGKTNGGLRTHLAQAFLTEFVNVTKSLGMLAGLAGSLRIEDIEPLVALQPDILGFRGALCEQVTRTNALCATKITSVRAEITRCSSCDASARSGEPTLMSDAARRRIF